MIELLVCPLENVVSPDVYVESAHLRLRPQASQFLLEVLTLRLEVKQVWHVLDDVRDLESKRG